MKLVKGVSPGRPFPRGGDGRRYNPLRTARTTFGPLGLTRINMSTTTLGPAGTGTGILVPFPDPPRHPDEMNSFRHLAKSGSAYLLAQHFGDPQTTVIDGELYVALDSLSSIKGLRAPDMLIAFDADPEACARRNAYVIAEQGKPPDFVLEVGSPSIGHIDVDEKPADYAALGILEYWRFDETGASHGTRLAGDRLVGDRYAPIAILELSDGSLEGYSAVLGLNLRWEEGQLTWYDPETDTAIMSLAEMQHMAEEERAARLAAEHRATAAEHWATAERQSRLEAERIAAERIRELEAQLRRRGS